MFPYFTLQAFSSRRLNFSNLQLRGFREIFSVIDREDTGEFGAEDIFTCIQVNLVVNVVSTSYQNAIAIRYTAPLLQFYSPAETYSTEMTVFEEEQNYS